MYDVEYGVGFQYRIHLIAFEVHPEVFPCLKLSAAPLADSLLFQPAVETELLHLNNIDNKMS